MKKMLILFTSVFLILNLVFLPDIQVKAAPRLNAKSVVLIKGQKKTLKLIGTKAKVTWKSKSQNIASVSKKGVINALKKGTTKITAKTGKKNYSCTIKVEEPKISQKTLTLKINKSYSLKMIGTKQKTNWSSSNTSVAEVTKTGKVAAKKAGNTRITAMVGGKKYYCAVTVPKSGNVNKVTSIKLSEDRINLLPADTKNLNATLYPTGLTGKRITWTSSDNSTAMVDSNGKIIGIRRGNVVITASCEGFTASCLVTVKGTGSINGMVSAPHSIVAAYVNDTGAIVLLFPTSGAKDLLLKDSNILSFNDAKLFTYSTKVDGSGRYWLNNVAEGDYQMFIMSSWSRSTRGGKTLYRQFEESPSFQYNYGRFAQVVQNYFNDETAKQIISWGNGRSVIGARVVISDGVTSSFGFTFEKYGMIF